METEMIEVLQIELSFYCGKKGDCGRTYTCIIPGRGLPDVCSYLTAKSDREIGDKIRKAITEG